MRFKHYKYRFGGDGDEAPAEGFVKFTKDDIVVYDRMLTKAELRKYDLIDLNEPVKQLARLRSANKMTQAKLAEQVGVPVRTVQAWEKNGMGGSSLVNAFRVSRVLHVPITDLIEPEDKAWKPKSS